MILFMKSNPAQLHGRLSASAINFSMSIKGVGIKSFRANMIY